MVGLRRLHHHLGGSLLHGALRNLLRGIGWNRLTDCNVFIELLLAYLIADLAVTDRELLVAVDSHGSASQVDLNALVWVRVIITVLWHDGHLPRNSIDEIVTGIVIQFQLAHPDRTSYVFVRFRHL